MKKKEKMKKDVTSEKKNLILDLINYYLKAIVVFFLIFIFLISPYNILLKLNPVNWVKADFYERILMSLGYGFVFNSIPIAWGALIYFPIWYFISRRKMEASDYKLEFIYIILFASAFFHVMILFLTFSGEIVSLKVLLPF